MGRPKGSKNKRKGRLKITRVYKFRDTAPVVESNGHDIEAAKALTQKIKTQLVAAEPTVAKLAINDLLNDLQMVAKIVNGMPPAP